MKHNPRLNEKVAALPGHARLHPAQDPKRAQGALELMWRLERALQRDLRPPHVSLQPSAGSHGELAGLLLTRAYHDDRGEQRNKVLTARHRARDQPGDRDHGRLRGGQGGDRRARRRRPRRPAREGVGRRRRPDAHQPEHARLFDENIAEIASIVHGVGGTLYYDGANLNAIMGWTRPGDMGFDIVHLNLHKSFSQPHGGGRPGLGADRRLRADRALPAGAADRSDEAARERRRAELRPRLRRRRSRSGGCAASRATSASSSAPTPTSRASAATACARRRRPRS